MNSGNFYLVYICEMDKSTSSKSILATTTVTLDASNSEPCEDDSQGCDDYIAEYNWDLNLERDEDGDGNPENDADLTGETVEWKELAPGEYKIALTVINGAGFLALMILLCMSTMLVSGKNSPLEETTRTVPSISISLSLQLKT